MVSRRVSSSMFLMAAGERALAALRFPMAWRVFVQVVRCTRMAPTMISKVESAGHHFWGPWNSRSLSYMAARDGLEASLEMAAASVSGGI